MKYLFSFTIALFILWPFSIHAANLLQVYRDGLLNDPTFKAAEAQKLATEQLVPINRGALLPNIGATGSITESHVDQNLTNDQTSFSQRAQQYTLTANQVIFDYAAWNLLKNAKAQAKQAQATYDAAAQDLMMRVSNAYFAVLQAYDTLLATQAQKRSLAEQRRQTEEQFKVGLIAITAVDQVRASYDATIAQEIANKTTVSDKLEELRAITGIFYTQLTGIKDKLPLVSPEPNNINEWVKVAERQNYTLLAARYGVEAAKDMIKVQQGGHLPVINATSSYSYDNFSAVQFIGGSTVSADIVQTSSIGIAAQLPIYSGGTVTAQTRQASYQYAQVSAQMEQTRRNVLTQTREAFLGVISGISKIKADKQAVLSNESSLAATKSGYTVGTNTILDVLEQQSDLFVARTNYTTDQYAYLINTLSLKQAAGTLSENDLAIINSWLKEHINLSAYNFDVTPPSYTVEETSRPSPSSPSTSTSTSNTTKSSQTVSMNSVQNEH